MLSIAYGGPIGGAISMVLLLLYRASLGGLSPFLAVVIDSVLLFWMMMWIRHFEEYLRDKHRLVRLSILIGAISYLIVESTIAIYFVLIHHFEIYLHQGILFFSEYGLIWTVAYALSVALIENLFQQAKVEQQVQEAEKVALLGELAASIAHEIRNPLTVSKGLLQLLRRGANEPEKENYYFELAEMELSRAEDIITEYLNFAKPEVAKVTVLPLLALLNAIRTVIEPYAVLHNVRLETYAAQSICIVGDERKFHQLMINLIKNAVEACVDGGVVQVCTTENHETVIIHVTDTGRGMTTEQLMRLGKPFYTTESKGTGLGLMVAYRFAASMQGTLEFQSEPGVGTTAILEFPIYTGQLF